MWKCAAYSCAAAVLLIGPAAAQTLDPIKAGATRLRADKIETLRFSASGATFTVGQNFTPDEPWPRVAVKM